MAQKILLIACFFGLTTMLEAVAQEPAAPSGLTATPVSKTQIALGWSDNSTNEEKFLLQRRTENGSWENIDLGPNITSYTDEGLDAATTYYYQIRAEGTCLIVIFPRPCSSEFSNEAKATTLQNPPTIDPVPDPAPVSEDAGLQTIGLSGISDGENTPGSQTISIEASSGNTALIPNPRVTYSSGATTGTLSYQPVANQHGTAEITVTVIDGGLENRITEVTFTVVVQPANDPPTLSEIAAPPAIPEDSDAQSIALSGITAGPGEEQDLTVSAVSGNKSILPDPAVSYSSPGQTATLSYTPVSNSYGTATVTVTVDDSEGGTVSRDVDVLVLPVNDAPAMDSIPDSGPLSPDAGQQQIALTGIIAGPNESQNMTISAVSGNPALIPDPVVTYTSPEDTGVLTFTPVAGSSGTADITVTVKDDGGTENGGADTFQQTFTIAVLSKPDLVIEEARVIPDGQSVALSAHLGNSGKKDAGTSLLAYYISAEEIWSEEATKLGETAIAPLQPGGSRDINESLQLPSTIAPGTYYVFFVADAENSVDEFSEENNVVGVEIVIENMPPRITETNFPELYTVGSQTANIDITVADNSGIAATIFHYRPVTEKSWKAVKINTESNTYTFSLNDNIFDEIGLAYFFEITDEMGLKTISDTSHVYISYPGDGLNIPNIQTGTVATDYQIIAVPLRLGNSEILSAFGDDLGQYDPGQWRFFHYENDKEIEFGQGLNELAPGKGYWLITKENNNVDTGIGSTVAVTQENPFTLSLKKGWNQIGNPYNFDLSWKKILAFNGNPKGVGKLRVYNNGFEDSNLLERFKGAFVFADDDIALQVPVVKSEAQDNGAENGRKLLREEDGSWEVQFFLSAGRLSNSLGGLGMKADAREGKDPNDAVALPAFDILPQLEVVFQDPGYPGFALSKEIVAPSPEYKWEMEVVTNLDGEVTLRWNKIDLPKDLVLFDVARQQVVDMKRQHTYRFHAGQSGKFQVLYGTPEYIESTLSFSRVSIGEAYPNPMRELTYIPVTLPGKSGLYAIHLEVVETSGESLGIVPAGTYGPGRHTITWSGKDGQGHLLPPGVYVLKLHIDRDGQQHQVVRKVMIH